MHFNLQTVKQDSTDTECASLIKQDNRNIICNIETMSGTVVTCVVGKSALLQVHKLLLNYCGDNCEDIFVLVLHICHQFKSLNTIIHFILKPVI